MIVKSANHLLLFLLVFSFQATAQQAVFRGGPGKNGIYTGNDFNYIKENKWQYKTGGAVRSTPLYYEGRIYTGSADGNMYCVDAGTGKKIWSFYAGNAIHSSAAISNGRIVFTDKKNILYSLAITTGKKVWQTDLKPDQVYEWGFDYYKSSPMIYDGIVYAGSGSGAMYALNEANGKIKWEYKTNSLVRSSPSYYENTIYFGDLSGKVYAINAKTGEKKWQFATTGDTNDNEKEGNDAKAVMASVAVKENIAVIGGRDGFLYGLNAATGAEIWRYDFEGSWILSSVAIKDNTVITGTSDGRVIEAVDLYTGKEKWKYKTPFTVWASPIIVGSTVVGIVSDGFMYILDFATGMEKSRYRFGGRALSSPVFHDGIIYTGNDDGNISAIQTETRIPPRKPVRKAVFYTSDIMGQIKPGMSTIIKDYFVGEGYELLNESKLPEFLKANSTSSVSSVVVFAAGYFQPEITTGTYRNSILYNYLTNGGKIVVIGVNPAFYVFDTVAKQYKGLDYRRADSLIGITYQHNDLRSYYGTYPSIPTPMGKKWGLTQTIPSTAAVNVEQVTPLAIDENGKAAYWVKNYGYKEGTGFVQLWIQSNMLYQLSEIRKIADYGID